MKKIIHRNIIKEHFILIGMLLISLVLVYFIPQSFNRVIFLFFPLLLIRSKRNYIWIAFFFLLLEQPGGLFFGGAGDDKLRLPLYNIAAGISFSFEQLMLLVLFYKAIKLKQKFNPFFKKNLLYLLLYFLLLIVLSLATGMSIEGFKYLYKIIINLTLFYTMFFLIKGETEWNNFFSILLPFSFYALLFQVYSLTNGYQLLHLFKPEVFSAQGVFGNISITEWERPIEMINISFVCFFISLYYLSIKDKRFSKLYLIAINTISFLSIFLTGTRAWILSLIAAYLLLIVFNPKKIGGSVIRFGAIILVGLIILNSFSVLGNQFGQAFDRFKTLEAFAKGDITAGGTAQRFDQRAPAVMKAYENSNMLFGSGFSDYYLQHADGHIGYQNFLFNAGITGTFLIFLFIFRYLNKLVNINRMLSHKNRYKNASYVFIAAIISILILHSSTQFIGYDIITSRMLTITIFLYFSIDIFNRSTEVNLSPNKSGNNL